VVVQPVVGDNPTEASPIVVGDNYGYASLTGEFGGSGDRTTGYDYTIKIAEATTGSGGSGGNGNGGSGGNGTGGSTPVAPHFTNEARVVIPPARKHGKPQTSFQLNFSQALSPLASNTGLYQVVESKRKGKHKVSLSPDPVTSVTLGPGGTSVMLLLARFVKTNSYSVSTSALTGANGAAVPSFSTQL
jgi:hypothetical protein